jgi:hypothetical protein
VVTVKRGNGNEKEEQDFNEKYFDVLSYNLYYTVEWKMEKNYV